MVEQPSYEDVRKQFLTLLDRLVKANEAYQAELDKPKRNSEARYVCRQEIDAAFSELITFTKTHSL